MSKKRNRLTLANAETLVYIFHNTRAIGKIENVALNTKYAADVEAMLLEQSIGRGSETLSRLVRLRLVSIVHFLNPV